MYLRIRLCFATLIVLSLQNLYADSISNIENSMLKNNIEVDVKVKCIEDGVTQAQLAEKIGTTGQYVNRIIKKQDGVVNKTFVQMLEALGYDIELTYVKREDSGGAL